MASFSSGRPPAGVYLWFFGSRQASTAASTMCGGRREVGLAGAEADHRLARRLQRLGLGVDGERGGLGDGGDALATLRASVRGVANGLAPCSVSFAIMAR